MTRSGPSARGRPSWSQAELLEAPEALAAAIVERQITIWDSAPAALQRLVPSFSLTASRGCRSVS